MKLAESRSGARSRWSRVFVCHTLEDVNAGMDKPQILGRSGRRQLQRRIRERDHRQRREKAQVLPESPEAVSLFDGWDSLTPDSRRDARAALLLHPPEMLIVDLAQKDPVGQSAQSSCALLPSLAE